MELTALTSTNVFPTMVDVTQMQTVPIVQVHSHVTARTDTVETEHRVPTSTNVLLVDTIVTRMPIAGTMMVHLPVSAFLDSLDLE